ncbi:hypothetical protein ABBQ38_001863 [Trebouxia sp. C0009 RCD-2024]
MIVRQVNRHLIMADIAADIGIPHQLTLLLMPPVKAVARQIIWNCLWMWDGALGFRAMTDSHGDRPGIWLAKFQTVRYASMLLALQRVNMALQTESAGEKTLFQAWTYANTKQKDKLVSVIVAELKNITEAEAQALAKDPEAPGFHYKLCSMWQACCLCGRQPHNLRSSSSNLELLWRGSYGQPHV